MTPTSVDDVYPIRPSARYCSWLRDEKVALNNLAVYAEWSTCDLHMYVSVFALA